MFSTKTLKFLVWFTVRVLLVRIWLTFSGAKDPEAALLLAEDGRNDLEQVRPAGWQQRRRADAKNLALVHRRLAEGRVAARRCCSGASSRQLSRTKT